MKVTTEQKRKYEKPSMEVFEWDDMPKLLAGSGGTEDYDHESPTNW